MAGSSAHQQGWIVGAARLLRSRTPPVVLCYHGIGPGPEGGDPNGLYVSEEAFTGQLDLLTRIGYRLVSAGELWRVVAARGPLGARGLAAVTFDDGLADTLPLVAALLAERGASGTAFLLAGRLGATHPDLPGRRLVDADDVRALLGGSLEIGSHGLTHVDLPTLDRERTSHELRASREGLAELTGQPVTGLAYPYGRFTALTAEVAAEAGYDYACGCSGAGPWRRYEVPREAVFPTTTPLRLRVKAAGVYGPLAAARAVMRRGR